MNQSSRSFDYSLRVSARARHVRLAVKPFQGLEVVIPKRFPKKKIPHILQQHEAWITRQLEKHQHSLQETTLPDSIFITLTDEHYTIQYKSSGQPQLIQQDYLLILSCLNDEQGIQLLRNWIRNKAWEVLSPKLEQLASELGFTFSKTSIRSQKSRWGSCSSSGTISLNDQLLFMPAETVRYLMVHELCHTRHMNHSPHFWHLVESHCANFKQLDKGLSKGRTHVPDWFSRSLFC
ncbi:MAG: M48 family metallopeptidase [Gammaproteobacteria bacterium]|nr:M48 family metallopeptidase [Gammaproteobacteria bacterium]MBT3725394.1 M48 family metallopeptidase [Gammaproteobacteria bacterium]MBT4076681.1 M48 family metallopeptidase [Gammaproteobacteria bacterium]MBT4193964.1 M48 family metallopeptidase [Gammaproteobacteria bacterium]MBT4448342.1 M48 family metallopeptidase [Gammaproteobacteria bacterium]